MMSRHHAPHPLPWGGGSGPAAKRSRPKATIPRLATNRRQSQGLPTAAKELTTGLVAGDYGVTIRTGFTDPDISFTELTDLTAGVDPNSNGTLGLEPLADLRAIEVANGFATGGILSLASVGTATFDVPSGTRLLAADLIGGAGSTLQINGTVVLVRSSVTAGTINIDCFGILSGRDSDGTVENAAGIGGLLRLSGAASPARLNVMPIGSVRDVSGIVLGFPQPTSPPRAVRCP